MNGAYLQSLVSRFLSNASVGVPLTVTRPATTQGGTPTTQTVSFRPQPLVATSANDLLLEAGRNAGDENPYDFETDGGQDVAENDLIGPFDGLNWRVFKTNAEPLGTDAPTLHCYAAREGKV